MMGESSHSKLFRRLKEIFGLKSEPVAIYLLAASDERRSALSGFTCGPGHRY